jgi:hypothetical protein
MMGNRGGRIHHNDRQELQSRRWASKQWITCLLEFKGRHRPVMSPNHYTELFFLDEATAFAAGHRPCAECRRLDFNRFMAAWMSANGSVFEPAGLVRAPVLDAMLHTERVRPSGEQVTHESELHLLPPGTFVALDERSWLVTSNDLRLWTPAGYAGARALTESVVNVLTPKSIVNSFRSGYVPSIHPAGRLQ